MVVRLNAIIYHSIKLSTDIQLVDKKIKFKITYGHYYEG